MITKYKIFEIKSFKQGSGFAALGLLNGRIISGSSTVARSEAKAISEYKLILDAWLTLRK
jgi:hypothetical protein